MDRDAAISRLKKQLRTDVASLYRRDGRVWSRPIVDILHDLREANVRAVLFGGTLRSLLLSRLEKGRFGRPRDLDIVVSGVSLDELRHRFGRYLRRETRFGGLQLENVSWQFDVWPLEQTWAFQKSTEFHTRFAALPMTTFFNLEAIAIDVWADPGRQREIYSADDRFFQGVLDRVLELNRRENPFPALCVVRSLVFASSTGFAIGPALARYLTEHSALDDVDLLEVQRKHYGQVRLHRQVMREWLSMIAAHVASRPDDPFSLPRHQQMTLWPEDDVASVRIHLLNGGEQMQDRRPEQ